VFRSNEIVAQPLSVVTVCFTCCGAVRDERRLRPGEAATLAGLLLDAGDDGARRSPAGGVLRHSYCAAAAPEIIVKPCLPHAYPQADAVAEALVWLRRPLTRPAGVSCTTTF